MFKKFDRLVTSKPRNMKIMLNNLHFHQLQVFVVCNFDEEHLFGWVGTHLERHWGLFIPIILEECLFCSSKLDNIFLRGRVLACMHLRGTLISICGGGRHSSPVYLLFGAVYWSRQPGYFGIKRYSCYSQYFYAATWGNHACSSCFFYG